MIPAYFYDKPQVASWHRCLQTTLYLPEEAATVNCELSSVVLPQSPPNYILRQSQIVTMVGEHSVHTQVCFPTTVVAKPCLIGCYGLTWFECISLPCAEFNPLQR